jgi:hypothetical protein
VRGAGSGTVPTYQYRKSLDICAERKRGFSDLELLCEELDQVRYLRTYGTYLRTNQPTYQPGTYLPSTDRTVPT